MKLITTFISTLLTLNLFAQVTNNSFDNWELVGGFGQAYEIPVGWQTNNHRDINGFNVTPVIKLPTSDGFLARIESNNRGIDSFSKGILYQKISTKNLSTISYESKCDSIDKLGSCVVLILNSLGDTILYTDSIKQVETQFNTHTIDIDPEWVTGNDSIIVKFEAYGNLFYLEPALDAYAVFLVDNIKADLKLSTEKINLSDFSNISIYPNPTTGIVWIKNAKDFDAYAVFSTNGQRNQLGVLEQSISLRTLNAGMYIIQLRGAKGVQNFRVMKQ